MSDVLRAVTRPDHVAGDPIFDARTRYYARGAPQAGEGEETPEGHVVRYAPGTSQIVGLTVLGARRVLERDGHLSVTVPETVETTAEQLAPALAAV
jgi:hypothetical protein